MRKVAKTISEIVMWIFIFMSLFCLAILGIVLTGSVSGTLITLGGLMMFFIYLRVRG